MQTKRQLQLGELLKRNFSLVLQQEGRYIYGDVLVSVTKVMVTPDFALAKVYLSVYGAEDKQSIIDMMNENLFTLKQSMVQKIKNQVRRIPQFALYEDDTLDEMYRIDAMLSKLNIKKEEEE